MAAFQSLRRDGWVQTASAAASAVTAGSYLLFNPSNAEVNRMPTLCKNFSYGRWGMTTWDYSIKIHMTYHMIQLLVQSFSMYSVHCT